MSETAQKYATVAIGIVVVALVLNYFIAAGTAISEVTNEPTIVETEGGSGTIYSAAANILGINSSSMSLEDAVELTGAGDSEVTARFDSDVSRNWSFCTWARADSSVVTGDESRSIAGVDDVALSYNGTSNEYQAWYYNASSRESFAVSVAAPTPTNMTLVCAEKAAGDLTIYRNTTAGGTVSTQGSGSAPGPPSANWDGELEETRLWDYALTSSQRSEFHSDPVLSVDGPAPVARLSYDVRDRSVDDVPIHFASGSASLSNAELVDGFDDVAVSEGTDFTVENGNQLVPTSTGVVDGDGSVVYLRVTAESAPFLQRLGRIVDSAIGLLALALIVIAATAIWSMWEEF